MDPSSRRPGLASAASRSTLRVDTVPKSKAKPPSALRHTQSDLKISADSPMKDKDKKRWFSLPFSKSSKAKVAPVADPDHVVPQVETAVKDSEPKSSVNIIVYGNSTSGKSTLMKSANLLSNRYLDDYCSHYGMLELAVERMVDVINGMNRKSFDLANTDYMQHLRASGHNDVSAALREFACGVLQRGHLRFNIAFDTDAAQTWRDAITALWKDPQIREAYQWSCKHYAAPDSVYLFENVQRFVDGYQATEGEMARVYLRTKGVVGKNTINTTDFLYEGVKFSTTDYSGTRTGRKTWTVFNREAHVILFVVDLTCWNHGMIDDPDDNAMYESLLLFKATITSSLSQHKKVMLVFTHANGLEAQLTKHPLEQYDATYTGGPNASLAKKHIHNKFLELAGPQNLHRLHVVDTDILDGLQKPAETIFSAIIAKCWHIRESDSTAQDNGFIERTPQGIITPAVSLDLGD